MKRPCICIVAGFALGEILAYAIMERQPTLAVFLCVAAFMLCAAMMIPDLMMTADVTSTPEAAAAKRIIAKAAMRQFLLTLALSFLFGFFRLYLDNHTLRQYEKLNAMCTGTAADYETEITGITVKDKRLTLRCDELIVYYTPARDAASPLYSPDDSYYGNSTDTAISSTAYGDELAGIFSIGSHIRVTGDFEPMDKPRNPGEFNYYLYYRASGVSHRCFADTIEVKDDHVNLFSDALFRIRRTLLARIDTIYDDSDAGVLRAVLLGDKSELSEDINDLYRKNGIAHLLAISGLHVGIIGMSLYSLLRKRLKLPYAACGLICGTWMLFYCLLTGAGVSTLRATSMLLIMFLAEVMGMHYDMLNSAGLAAVIILIIHPYQLFNCAFLLSFACIIAIAGPSKFIISELRVKNHILGSLILSITIQLFTLPITAYFFFEVSPYGCLLNLIVIPLMTIVVWSSITATLISFLWPVGAHLVAAVSHYILALYTWLGSHTLNLPYSSILIGRPALWQICVYYFLFFLVLYSYRLKDLIPRLRSSMSVRATASTLMQEKTSS